MKLCVLRLAIRMYFIYLKSNFKRSFWKMIQFWSISEKTKAALLRPMLVYIFLTITVAYLSNSFNFLGIIEKMGITAVAVIAISFAIFIWQFLFSTPYEFYKEQKKQIDDLKRGLDILSKRQELFNNLESILTKYEDFNFKHSSYPMIYNEHPAYSEILQLLQESKIVLPKIISCFKDGVLPDHLKNRIASRTLLDNRWAIIDSLRDNEVINFFS